MKKLVTFMVEETDHFASEIECSIVETYYPDDCTYHGYAVLCVEVENISDIRIINDVSGIEYEADEVEKGKDGVYHVTIWKHVQ